MKRLLIIAACSCSALAQIGAEQPVADAVTRTNTNTTAQRLNTTNNRLQTLIDGVDALNGEAPMWTQAQVRTAYATEMIFYLACIASGYAAMHRMWHGAGFFGVRKWQRVRVV